MKKLQIIDLAALSSYLETKGITEVDSLIEELSAGFNSLLDTKVRQEKNRSRIKKKDS